MTTAIYKPKPNVWTAKETGANLLHSLIVIINRKIKASSASFQPLQKTAYSNHGLGMFLSFDTDHTILSNPIIYRLTLTLTPTLTPNPNPYHNPNPQP